MQETKRMKKHNTTSTDSNAKTVVLGIVAAITFPLSAFMITRFCQDPTTIYLLNIGSGATKVIANLVGWIFAGIGILIFIGLFYCLIIKFLRWIMKKLYKRSTESVGDTSTLQLLSRRHQGNLHRGSLPDSSLNSDSQTFSDCQFCNGSGTFIATNTGTNRNTIPSEKEICPYCDGTGKRK
jgi:hypothetical protein